MLTKLFESVDEKIFTPETKEELSKIFESEVDKKANELAAEKVAELEESVDKRVEDKVVTIEEELTEKASDYIDRAVEEMVESNAQGLADKEAVERSQLILEAFETMVIAGGVDIARILKAGTEANINESSDIEDKLDELKDKYDSVVNEMFELRKENDKLVKSGIILEMQSGMSILEAQKFERLAEMVTFDRSEDYLEKLEQIKESVVGDDSVVEEQTKEELVESEKPSKKAYAHLI